MIDSISNKDGNFKKLIKEKLRRYSFEDRSSSSPSKFFKEKVADDCDERKSPSLKKN